MYLHLGNGVLVKKEDVIGVFDLEITSQSYRTRQYLKQAEQRGHLAYVDIEEIPKSFLVCAAGGEGQTVIVSPLSPRTLLRRWENGSLTEEEQGSDSAAALLCLENCADVRPSGGSPL